MRQDAASQRPKQTVFGAKVRPGQRPVVTIAIIAACVLMFGLDYVAPDLWRRFVFAPSVGEVEPWRALTSAFLHAGMIHLAFNMVALWITGPFLEQALGRARFVALYLTSALGGSVAVVLLTSLERWNVGTVGASGAVFGLFGAVAVVMARLRRPNNQILGIIAINLVIGFLIPGISWQAHIGGLITGAVIAAIYAYVPKRAQTVGAVVGVALVAAVLIAAALIRYATL